MDNIENHPNKNRGQRTFRFSGHVKRALLCFIGNAILNSIIIVIWSVFAWGMRGSGYELGRPSPEDLYSKRIIIVMIIIATGMNLGVPAYFALRRKWEIAIGFLAGGTVLAIVCVGGAPIIDAILLLAAKLFNLS